VTAAPGPPDEPPLPELTGERGRPDRPKRDRVALFALGAAIVSAVVPAGLFVAVLTGGGGGLLRARFATGTALVLLAPLEIMALSAGVLRWPKTEGKIAVALVLGAWLLVIGSAFL
jgi:hypothetical protein